MTDTVEFEIPIPLDMEGYVLLKCPSCSEEFMLKVEDIEDESNIKFWCPGCGLLHDLYMPDEVEELSERIIENHIVDIFNEVTKELGKTLKNHKNIKFKSGNKIKKQYEFLTGRKLGDFTKKEYRCCNKVAKVLNIRNFIGGYCPFCGGLINGD